jgi:hypothetical protein
MNAFLTARRFAIGLGSLLLFTGGVASAVPCRGFGGLTCPNPIVQGTVDGQWIGIIYHFDGTNGGPSSLLALTIGVGGNGALTVPLGVIKPEGGYADRMNAEFRAGKLYVSNAIYLPGEAHCCYTQIAVRRYGFRFRKLVIERLATIASGASASEVDAALEKGPHLGD